MSRLDNILTIKLKKLFQSSQIVFWYDDNGFFQPFIQKLSQTDFSILKFKDSWFELKYQIEGLFDSESFKNFLAYIPFDRLDYLNVNPLTEIEKAGKVFEFSRELLIREALNGSFDETEISRLITDPNTKYEEINELSKGGEIINVPPVVKLFFKTEEPISILLTFLIDKQIPQKIKKRGKLEEFLIFIKDNFGIAFEQMLDLKDLNEFIIQTLLLFNLKLNYSKSRDLMQLQNIDLPIELFQRQNCISLLNRFKENRKSTDIFIEWSNTIEKKINLDSWNFDIINVLELDLFEFFDNYILKNIGDLIGKISKDNLNELLRVRKNTFWVLNDPKIRFLWDIASRLIKLDLKIDEFNLLLSSKSFSFDELFNLYVDLQKNDFGFYVIDTYYRQIENLLTDYDYPLPFNDYLEVCRQKYYKFLEGLNEISAKLINEYSASSKIKQNDFFKKFIKPKLGKNTIAFFTVDALRYEMGVELANSLSKPNDLKIIPCLANLPTLTYIGMTAILPEANSNFILIEKQGRINVKLHEKIIVNPRDRIKWIEEQLSNKILDMTLDEILSKRERIKPKLKDVELIIVRSNEIDLLGEQDKIYQIRKNLSGMIKDLKRAIEILSNLGISDFIITSDHGFLFGEELKDDMKIDAPQGRKVEIHRRVWIGSGGTETSSTIKIKANELGYESDLDFIFPSNLGSFKKAGGNKNYLHGGISLQEIIVPVIGFSLPVKSKSKTTDKFEVKIPKDEINMRIFNVEIIYSIEGSLDKFFDKKVTKPINCRIKLKKNEYIDPVNATEEFNQETKDILVNSENSTFITFLLPEKFNKGELTVQILDSNTSVILKESKKIPYEIYI